MRKIKIFFAVLLSLILVLSFAACREHIHQWGEWEESVPATCTDAGTEKRVCLKNKKHTETRATTSLEHDWGLGTEVEGVTTFICNRDSSHIQTYSKVKTVSLSGKTVSWTGGNSGISYQIYIMEDISMECAEPGNVYETVKTIAVSNCTVNSYTLTEGDLSGLYNGSYVVRMGVSGQQTDDDSPKAAAHLVITGKALPTISFAVYNMYTNVVSWESSSEANFFLEIYLEGTHIKNTAVSTATTIDLTAEGLSEGKYVIEIRIQYSAFSTQIHNKLGEGGDLNASD